MKDGLLMEMWERNKHITRIISGQIRIKTFYVRSPSIFDKYLAEEIFEDALQDAIEEGIRDEAQMSNFLDKANIYTIEDDKNLKILFDNIEKLKISLFENRFKTRELTKIRAALLKTKNEHDRLNNLKHSYDHLTTVGMAMASKQRYLLGCSLFLLDGTKYWNGNDNWNVEDPILDKVMFKLNEERLDEDDYRDIARNEPWRTLWGLQKHCKDPLFIGSPADLTEDQKNIVIWSSIYESIREHPDVLDDYIFEDNDMIDGWMLIKKKERDKNKVSLGNESSNEKIRNSKEQFRIADSNESIERIRSLNDDNVNQIVKKKMDLVKQKGVVSEIEMPDVVMDLKTKQQQKLHEHLRGLGGK